MNARLTSLRNHSLLLICYLATLISSGLYAANPDFALAEDTVALYRVNAGGPAIPALDGGIPWGADELNSPSPFLSDPGSNDFSSFTFASYTDAVDQSTTPVSIFGTERFDFPGNSSITYSFPVVDGEYEVRLYMGNGWDLTANPGDRIFSVQLEDTIPANLDSLDLSAQFGHQVGAVVINTVTITDGAIDISFLHGPAQNPLINGIEILGNAAGIPISVGAVQDQRNAVGDVVSRVFTATGGDPTEPFTFTLSGQPDGISILDASTGLYGGTIQAGAETGGPNNDGIYPVTLTVEKPSSEDVRLEFIWTVLPEGADLLDNWNLVLEGNANVHTPRQDNGFVQVADRFYLVGGRTNAQLLEIYDFENDVWSTGPDAPVDLYSFQALEYKGLLWVAGAFTNAGQPFTTPAKHIYLYDPTAKVWITGPSVPPNRKRGAAAAVVYNDNIYLIGGNRDESSGQAVAWMDEFNPSTGTWAVMPNAPSARDHFHAVVVDDKLYAIGGRRSGGENGPTNPVIAEVDVFDFNTGTWSTLPDSVNLPSPRANAATVFFQEEIFVIGGEVNLTPDGGTVQDALVTTEAFNPMDSSWSEKANLNFKRQGTQAIVSGDGILITGGSQNLGTGGQTNFEHYGALNPSGFQFGANTLVGPFAVFFTSGSTEDVDFTVSGGIQGVYVEGFRIEGPDADRFSITSEVRDSFLVCTDEIVSLEVTLADDSPGARATLVILLGGGKTETIELVEGAPTASPVYLNAGGPAYTATDGTVFASDRNYTSSATFSLVREIASTEDDPLYHTERFGDFSYNIPIADGTYSIDLHFAEIFYGVPGVGGGSTGAGDRVFDVEIEGKTVLSDFDIFAEAGSLTALVKTIDNIEVEDKELNITFISQVNAAKISAIGVIPENFEPSIANPGNQTNQEGEDIALQLDADDGNGGFQQLTFTASNLPLGLTLDSATGLISGTLTLGTRALDFSDGASANSPYAVEIIVTDNGQPNLVDTVFFTWTVNEPDPILGVEVQIIPGASIDAGTEGSPDLITVVNTSDTGNIEALIIDLRTALLPDLHFDPTGAAGDGQGECFTADPATAASTGMENFTDPCTQPFDQASQGGYRVLRVNFFGFEPGDTLQFSLDVDPNSIKDLSGVEGPGRVSGLEWAGAQITAEFNTGKAIVGNVFEEGSAGGGRAILVDDPLEAPVLTVAGSVGTVDTVQEQIQVMEIQGTPGQYVALLQLNTALNTNGQVPFNVPDTLFYGNQALDIELYTTQLDSAGNGTIEVFLFANPTNSLSQAGGINYFLAVQSDTTYLTSQELIGLTSNTVILRYLPGDSDGDGVPDDMDNCPDIANMDQLDSDADGVGNDCDSCPTVPNEDQELLTYWLDQDEDGYGVPDSSVLACEAPAGFADNNLDCDDSNPGKNPGASEILNDLLDQDCNGVDSFQIVDEVTFGGVLSADLPLTPGSMFDVTFQVQAGVQNFNRVDLHLSYDQNIIQIIDFVQGTDLNVVTTPVTYINNDGTLDFEGRKSEGILNGTVDIVIVTFMLVGSDSSAIEFLARNELSNVWLEDSTVLATAPPIPVNVELTTNTEEVREEAVELVLFPNPVQDQLNLLISGKSGTRYQVRLFDGRGQIVYQDQLELFGPQTQQSLDLYPLNLAAGLYFLQLLSEDQSYITRSFQKQ